MEGEKKLCVVSNDLKWNSHIEKRAAVSLDVMLYFYIGIIRALLEYTVAVWHTSLTADLSDQLELIQKRTLRIIFGGSNFTNKSYESFCHKLHISPLAEKTWLGREDSVLPQKLLIQTAASVTLSRKKR